METAEYLGYNQEKREELQSVWLLQLKAVILNLVVRMWSCADSCWDAVLTDARDTVDLCCTCMYNVPKTPQLQYHVLDGDLTKWYDCKMDNGRPFKTVSRILETTLVSKVMSRFPKYIQRHVQDKSKNCNRTIDARSGRDRTHSMFKGQIGEVDPSSHNGISQDFLWSLLHIHMSVKLAWTYELHTAYIIHGLT